MKKFLGLFILSLVFLPNLVLASWWNPLTWGFLNRDLHLNADKPVSASTTLPEKSKETVVKKKTLSPVVKMSPQPTKEVSKNKSYGLFKSKNYHDELAGLYGAELDFLKKKLAVSKIMRDAIKTSISSNNLDISSDQAWIDGNPNIKDIVTVHMSGLRATNEYNSKYLDYYNNVVDWYAKIIADMEIGENDFDVVSKEVFDSRVDMINKLATEISKTEKNIDGWSQNSQKVAEYHKAYFEAYKSRYEAGLKSVPAQPAITLAPTTVYVPKPLNTHCTSHEVVEGVTELDCYQTSY
jgi:hypothetical protein